MSTTLTTAGAIGFPNRTVPDDMPTDELHAAMVEFAQEAEANWIRLTYPVADSLKKIVIRAWPYNRFLVSEMIEYTYVAPKLATTDEVRALATQDSSR